MSDISEQTKLKREHNKQASIAILKHKQISYVAKANNEHLAICHSNLIIDFWPTTGLWKVRNSPKENRGVFKLLKYLGVK
jgi:hypothetical protein